MKIIEKKCPNCGANLDFKVGERDTACGSCRRKFAIEYNHDEDLNELKQSALNNLSAKDFDLTADRRRAKIIMLFIAVIVIIGCTVAVINFVRTRQDEQNRKSEYEQSVEEMNQKAKERAEEMKKEYDEQVEKFENEQKERIEEMKSQQ